MATEQVTDFGETFDQYGSAIGDEYFKALGKRMVNAFKEQGYCYLTSHGINEEFIEEYMKVSQKFFEQPEELKSKFPMGVDYKVGWVKLEREHLNEKRLACDLHEAFNYTPTYDDEWLRDAHTVSRPKGLELYSIHLSCRIE